MELTMLREEHNREKAKSHSAVQSVMTNHSQVETERDAALAEVQDLKQQLSAVQADLELARADTDRIMVANNNLQTALEAFQDERQAELNMFQEQQKNNEAALEAAHQAAMEAAKQTSEAELRMVQQAADKAVKNAMDEISVLETKLEALRSENNQTRRSLDEAIHRLQSSQEDVIDRTLMKNIVIDWCTMKDNDKRHQVLELMAKVLDFSDEEKDKVHLTHMDIQHIRKSFVGALAAPLPPSKADVEHLEGENVREKWVNFLLAETDDL
jgi:chromosome segregation ATPase